MVKKVANSLLELIYPRLCTACENRLNEHEEILCLSCLVNLPKTNFHLQPENPMFAKFWGRVNVSAATALYYFTSESRIQNVIHEFKYKNQPKIGVKLGELLGKQFLENEHYKNIDAIIPVPLHNKKLMKRGYNQSEFFANGLSAVLNKPTVVDVLKRISSNTTQTKKNRWERWENVNTIFTIDKTENLPIIGSLVNKHILLVDDVMTTGATLEACAEKLLQINNVKVSVATIAFTEN